MGCLSCVSTVSTTIYFHFGFPLTCTGQHVYSDRQRIDSEDATALLLESRQPLASTVKKSIVVVALSLPIYCSQIDNTSRSSDGVCE